MITYKINQDISLEQAMNLIGKFPQYKWRNEEKTAYLMLRLMRKKIIKW